MLASVFHIIRKDLITDWRGRFSMVSSFLYLVAVVFVIHKIFTDISAAVRIALFWVVILFTAINLISQSFSGSNKRRKLIHYALYDPYILITAKLILNFVKLLLAGIILYFLQILFTHATTPDLKLLAVTYLLASLGITAILTLVSSVVSYSDEKSGLVSILALPLLIPVLLLAMRLSLVSERMFVDPSVNDYLWMLGGIDILLVTIAIIFFPLVWKS